MNVKRIALIGVAGGAVVVWLAAASTSRAPAPIVVSKTSGADMSGVRLAGEIARLRERLRPAAVPTQSRDLFRYAAKPSRPALQVAAEPVPLASVPPAPSLKLVGIAEDPSDRGTVRTAIISGGAGLFIVREGEIILSRYRVTAISPEFVDLTDAGENTPLRLLLP